MKSNPPTSFAISSICLLYTSADCVLTGCAYTPLREQFADQPYHLWEQVKDLFLSTGGTDPFHIAGSMLKRLCASDDWKDVSFHVLTGPMHVHRAELAVMAGKDRRIVPVSYTHLDVYKRPGVSSL